MPQGLDELEAQVVGEASHVVVALDVGGPLTPAGLDDIWVERALYEELDPIAVPDAARFACPCACASEDIGGGGLERPDELPADHLALGFWVCRVCQSGEGVEELALGVHDMEPDAGRSDVVPFDLLTFALTQQPMVDEHTSELVPDRALDQGGRNRRIDTAGEPCDDLVGADSLGDRLDGLLDDAPGRPGWLDPRSVVEEVLDDPLALLGMSDLGVPLHRVQAAALILERCDLRAARQSCPPGTLR